VNLRYKLIFQKLLYSYIIASYFSRIPSFFIDWQKGVPQDDYPPSLIVKLISFLLSPLYTPLALFIETMLAFVWGDIMYERLLPLITFLVVGLLSWYALGPAKYRTLLAKSRNIWRNIVTGKQIAIDQLL
jgi:hypothetical protein